MKRTHYSLMILISVVTLSSLTGCSNMMSSKMPPGSVSMEQAYNGAINGTNDNSMNLNQVRADVKPISLMESNIAENAGTASLSDASSINNQFPRLPNPNIVMYVYPHLTGTDPNQVPVPGYSTVFPLYDHVYYAMPGEVMGMSFEK